MKLELMWLVWAVVLTLVQMLVSVLGAMSQVGLPRLVGNRENMPPLVGWALRAQRAHYNMLESLVLFAALVLAAVAAGRTNATTLLGAELFVLARLVYAIVYVVGVPWLRTLVWFASLVGLLLILWQLF